MKSSPQPEMARTTSTAAFFSPSVGRGAFVQPKLTVNAPGESTPGDAYEQEADRVADAVLRMPAGAGFVQPKLRVNGRLQRKCAPCEEEEKHVQRKGTNEVSSATPEVETTLSRPGQALDSTTRTWAESRLGQDFSAVKMHTDGAAAESAASIGARAYTSGSNVVFGAGEFSPQTDSGRHLLAHELTHVVQQGGSQQAIQRSESVYEDIPGQDTQFRTDPDGQAKYEGHVDHAEYRNDADRQAHARAIHTSRINVRFNESTCELIVPLKIMFVNQTAATPTTCGDINGQVNDPIKPVSAAAFNETVKRFMTDIPAALNGWYSVVLDGNSCSPCREVPVRVEFTQVTSGPADRTVIVTGNDGRSYVSGGQTVALCGSDARDSGILTHEAGHFAFGAGDEYHEMQGKRPAERERLGEYSRMAQDAPERLLEFHERHFAFAAAFMRAMYPACQPKLKRTRSAKVEFTIPVGMYGFAPKVGQGDLGFSLGLQLGIPLMHLRRLSLTLGPNFSYLVLNQDFLVGFRAGLEGRLSLGNLGPIGTVGLGFRAFGEGGAQVDFSKSFRSPGVSPYLEGGGGLDLRLGDQGRIGFEAAKGVLDVGGKSPMDYQRYGLRFGYSF